MYNVGRCAAENQPYHIGIDKDKMAYELRLLAQQIEDNEAFVESFTGVTNHSDKDWQSETITLTVKR